MSLRINDEAPNFSTRLRRAPSTSTNGSAMVGRFCFHIQRLHSCLHHGARLYGGLEPEFAKRNCKIIGLSVDPVSSHSKWKADIEETQATP